MNYWKPSLWKSIVLSTEIDDCTVYRDRWLSQRNRIESSGTDYTHRGYLTYDKSDTAVQLGKEVFSTNNPGSTGYHMGKQQSWPLPQTLHKD